MPDKLHFTIEQDSVLSAVFVPSAIPTDISLTAEEYADYLEAVEHYDLWGNRIRQVLTEIEAQIAARQERPPL